MKKFFVYYNNNHFEYLDSINVSLLHMVDIGVIKIIVNNIQGTAWIRSEDGTSKEIKVPEVSGL